MSTLFSKAAVALTVMSVSVGEVWAQVAKPISATGPTLSGFTEDISSWFSSHQGAAIAIGIGALLVVGMMIYGRMYPDKS